MDIFKYEEIIQGNLNSFSRIIQDNLNYIVITALILCIVVILLSFSFALALFLNKMNELFTVSFVSPQIKKIYTLVIFPYQNWVKKSVYLILIDLVLLIVPLPNLLKYIEIPIGLSTAIIVGWLCSRLFEKFLAFYLAESTLKQKINGELLVVANIIGDAVIVLIIIFIFAQTHHINVVALVTSLGIGGIAIAFAAKGLLEQLLGGIVIYIDRPFVIDDYIGLPDGTFGRVESIGLRSTKIRNSGKGTLTIVPNNSLTELSIENFTGGRKIVSLIYLTLYRELSENERALISQVILESTNDLYGIDARNTEVSFKDFVQNGIQMTQAQLKFFILGSGEMGMDMRRQLLDVAKENIMIKLSEYGIAFDLQEKPINIDAPISI
ncbi:mechanosensitive ion channel family protein [Nostoc sp. KVJ3]|uniref:mechanosensitive ion channel family protein n=1 Tax=Nostoc sp. KVJ3 TaxID=457945 RepID=UPI00223707A5|nr:mechanosensitive ion channel family protein [Nostoc sp. KVJ3]